MRTKNIDAIFMVRLRQKEFMHRLPTHIKGWILNQKGIRINIMCFHVMKRKS